jgi:RHS repeat-associated protein
MPDGATERRRHDAAGRLVERVQDEPGERIVTRFTWEAGLLVGIDHPGQRSSIAHDDAGRVVAVEHELLGTRHRWTIERDASGRITAQRMPDGSRLRHRVDTVGRPVGLDYEPPGGGPAVPIVDRAVYRSGRPVGWRYGNGVHFERRNDASGRPIAWRWIGLDRLPDWRYRWGAHGLPLAIADRDSERRFGWDAFGRLVVHERHRRAVGAGAAPAPVESEYFAWDLAGDLRFAKRVDGRSWRDSDARVPRDGAGRPARHGELALHYGVQQRILSVTRGEQTLADYGYNAAGERVLARSAAGTTGFLYRGRALAAETDSAGRISRHYLRWQGQPVAIIDRNGQDSRITWLHGDHLGTPHAATDAAGRPVWHAEYDAFGRVASQQGAFRQPLRLAGQYHDAETGLHDNYQRTYDPSAARYLEPDPMGLAGGLNPWVYADGNPLLATDPLGLILFAFDGTNNGDPTTGLDDISNVRKFFDQYRDGQAWYMTGVGLDDSGSGIRTNALDALNANTARARVDYMLGALDSWLGDDRIGQTIDIDVVGFSRGAAMARDFVNRVAVLDAERYWWARGFCMNLRFLGLWDTVAQFGQNGSQNHRWQLGIPSAVGAAYHAVALNEHRSLFPLEGATGTAVIERGFIGSHADVGGGNAEGDLSDVSLVWMVRMAEQAGVRMNPLPDRYLRVESPLLHDRNDALGDRRVDVRDASGAIVARTSQRQAATGGMTQAGSRPFIIVSPQPELDAYGRPSIAGSVDMDAYSAWLASEYGIRVAAR